MRYRLAYWFFSFFTVLFITFRQHGETIVEHPFFIIVSIIFLLYAPFWMAKAVLCYEEQVQEEEIRSMDKQALRKLEKMSLGYRSSKNNSRNGDSRSNSQRLLEDNSADDIERAADLTLESRDQMNDYSN